MISVPLEGSSLPKQAGLPPEAQEIPHLQIFWQGRVWCPFICVSASVSTGTRTDASRGGLMVAKKTKKFKRSPADIKKTWQKLEPELAKLRKERQSEGETVTSITREEFEAKLKRVNSPMIVFQSWNNTAPPGGTINYTVG